MPRPGTSRFPDASRVAVLRAGSPGRGACDAGESRRPRAVPVRPSRPFRHADGSGVSCRHGGGRNVLRAAGRAHRARSVRGSAAGPRSVARGDRHDGKETIVFEVIHKAFLTGVGLAALAGEKVEEFAKELAEKGKLSAKESRELADSMLAQSVRAREDLLAKFDKWLEEALRRRKLVSKEDLKDLEARVAELEKAQRME